MPFSPHFHIRRYDLDSSGPLTKVSLFDKEGIMRRLVVFGILFLDILLFISVVGSSSDASDLNPRTLIGSQDAVNSLAFSPNGKILASGGDDAIVNLWDTATGKKVNTLRGHDASVFADSSGTRGSVNSVAFSPDGRLLASGGRDSVILWDTTSGEKMKSLGSNAVNSVAFSPDGRLLASGGRDSIILWDTATWEKMKEFQGHTRPVKSIKFDPASKLLASGSNDRTIAIWDTISGKKLHTLDTHSRFVQSIDISPDGRLLASVGNNPNIVLWDMVSGLILKRIPTLERSVALSVKFSLDGKTVVSSFNNGRIDFWDVKAGNTTKQLSHGRNSVNSVAFSQDGKMFASGDSGGNIKLWIYDTAERLLLKP
jgi:WD40 repeat protein